MKTPLKNGFLLLFAIIAHFLPRDMKKKESILSVSIGKRVEFCLGFIELNKKGQTEFLNKISLFLLFLSYFHTRHLQHTNCIVDMM